MWSTTIRAGAPGRRGRVEDLGALPRRAAEAVMQEMPGVEQNEGCAVADGERAAEPIVAGAEDA
jgi:hypothetical protein